MLSKYLPDRYSEDEPFLKALLIGYIDSELYAQSVPETDLSAYISDSKHERPILSARSITDAIDWYSLPDDHPFSPDSNGDGFTPDEWQLVREFSRIRGSTAHGLHSILGAEEAAEVLDSELAALEDVENPETMLEAVHRWPGANRVKPPEEVEVLDRGATDVLKSTAKSGARFAGDNWDIINREHDMTVLVDEPTIPEEVDGVPFCPCPDEVVSIPDSDALPPAIYTLDGKTGPHIKPAHIVQAEAQRRALDERLHAPVHGLILRLGDERGDWDILASTDDDWLTDKAWELFRRKAEQLYDDGRVQARLEQMHRGDGR